jgi:hypothetical protein
MIHWKPEGRKKRGRPRRTWKDGMYTAMNNNNNNNNNNNIYSTAIGLEPGGRGAFGKNTRSGNAFSGRTAFISKNTRTGALNYLL